MGHVLPSPEPDPPLSLEPQVGPFQSSSLSSSQCTSRPPTQPNLPSPPPSPTYFEIHPNILEIAESPSTLKRIFMSDFPPNKLFFLASDNQLPSQSLLINSINRSLSSLQIHHSSIVQSNEQTMQLYLRCFL